MKRALALAALAIASCGRAHLEPGYGHSYQAQFALQVEKPAHPRKVAPGLDAQEASIIASTYRKGLAPKETQDVKEQPILVVAPQQAGMAAQALAPSVPKE
ncbi:MAG TPA: hypothetical protein VF904_14590 [Anaeromyxobacteraceae bacterium]